MALLVLRMMEKALQLQRVLWLGQTSTARGRLWMRLLVVGNLGAWALWGRRLEVASGACCSHHHCRDNSLRLGLGMLGRTSLVDSDLPSTLQLLASIDIK